MRLEIKVPPMGESITAGTLAAWHVKDGDVVRKGQPLYELETDKITQEGQAEEAGVIRLCVGAGEEVKIGQVLATLDTSSADTPSTAESSAASQTAPAPVPGPVPIAPPRALQGKHPPSVLRLAAETGIDPSSVPGSGMGGRVTKGDMLAAAAARKTPPTPPPAPAPEPSAPLPEEAPPAPSIPVRERATRRKLTPIRKRIAERLVQAKTEAAILTTFNEIDMSAVKALRTRHQEEFQKRHGIKLGFMGFFIKAVVHALREVPQVAWMLEGDTVVENHAFDIGVAVSTDRGLMVPVLRDCDAKDIATLERELAEHAQRARQNKIGLEDLQGGVFTITNGGVFGSLLSTPILNPPQSGILGMHAIQDRPVAVDGQVVVRPMMYIALSYDHRIIDGREAVTFLVQVKESVEDPARLLLGL